MSSNWFDNFSQRLSARASRRATIRAGGLGVAGAALGAAGFHPAQAQEATPVAPSEISFLFIQNAGATTLTPVDGAMHTLTMTGIAAQTLYFSDRPARITGTDPTAAFIKAWDTLFATSPPNATLIGHPTVGDDVDVAVVVSLTDPVYDEAAETLTYQAEILGANRIENRIFEDAAVTSVDGPQEFAEAHLFIDTDYVACDACIEGSIITLGLYAIWCHSACES